MVDAKIDELILGPVVPNLQFKYASFLEEVSNKENKKRKNYELGLVQVEIDTIDAILDAYGCKDLNYLNELSRAESPWKKAMKDLLSPGCMITRKSMKKYYKKIMVTGRKV